MKTIILFCIILFSFFSAECQKKKISVFWGGGLAYVKTKGETKNPSLNYLEKISTSKGAIVSPSFNMSLSLPFSNYFFFETGISYQQRGQKYFYQEYYKFPIGTWRIFEMSGKLKIHYIRIPIFLGYHFYKNKNSKFTLGFGMDYGFAIKAFEKSYFKNATPKGKQIDVINYEPEIKLITGENRLVNNKNYWANLNMFDIAISGFIQYSFKEKYLIRLHSSGSTHAHYPIENNDLKTRLRFTGISLGYII